MSEHFEVVVIGAGPAGIAAAVRAAECGARVGLIDDNPAPGGQIWRSGGALPAPAREWLARLQKSDVSRMQGWRIFDSPAAGTVRAEQQVSGNVADIRYESLIVATGARERFLPFPGWTLPNVMGAGGLDAMVRGGLPIAGKRVIVAGTGPLLLAVAAHLAEAGARILAICEQASLRRLLPFALQVARQPGKAGQGIGMLLTVHRVRIHTRCCVFSARGDGKLESVTLRQPGRIWDAACDYLACGFHLVPNLELPLLLGCRIKKGFVAVDRFQRTSVPGVYCAGEPTGIAGVERALVEGEIAGLAAASCSAEAERLSCTLRASDRFMRALAGATALDPDLRKISAGGTLVCRCEDVSFAALREHANWRDAKLHTRCGMGACQGRICGAATEFLFGWTAESVRPPIFPVRVSSLAGGSVSSAADANTALQFNHREDVQ